MHFKYLIIYIIQIQIEKLNGSNLKVVFEIVFWKALLKSLCNKKNIQEIYCIYFKYILVPLKTLVLYGFVLCVHTSSLSDTDLVDF